MSVTMADLGVTVPEEWIEAVNQRLNDLMHDDLCHCDGWPDACASGYPPGRWDQPTTVMVAVAVLEPLIRAQIAEDLTNPLNRQATPTPAAPEDACRPVTLTSGETLLAHGEQPLTPEEVRALEELVHAARARLAAERRPPDERAVALWARIEAARGQLSAHAVARAAEVRPSVLFRVANGELPGEADLEAIERWLARVTLLGRGPAAAGGAR